MLFPPIEPISTAPPVPDDQGRRTELLREFGLITETDLATLWGLKTKTLRNKPLVDLPKFVTMGRQRLFYVDSVGEVMRNSVKHQRRRKSV